MGFYSSLILYRPGPPPRLNGEDLLRFVDGFSSLGLSVEMPGIMCGIQFLDPTATVSNDSDDELWDICEWNCSMNRAKVLLARTKESVVRAIIPLGGLSPNFVSRLQYARLGKGDDQFTPDAWSLHVGNIRSGRDEEFLIGGVAIRLSGNGYLYPYAPREIIGDIEAIPECEALKYLCQTTWPVASIIPTNSIQQTRAHMQMYWPYEDQAKPLGWYWGWVGVA